MKPLLDDPEREVGPPGLQRRGATPRTSAIAVRTAKCRYAEWTGGKGGAMLFDEAADPHETKNSSTTRSSRTVREELSALGAQAKTCKPEGPGR